MIDVTKLDPSKTYVGYEVGSNKVAKRIQAFCKKDLNLFTQDKPKENDIATHVFGFAWSKQDSKWFVYESHFIYDGARRLDHDTWIHMEKRDSAKQYFLFPFELSNPILDFYEKYNPGYGSGHMEDLSISEIHKKGGLSWSDYQGIISSEYLALSDIDYKVCNKFGMLPREVRPIHFQAYAYEELERKQIMYATN